ncbi:MAG TPA: NUDIX hydrolase [Actinomycetota bacterium]|jgi:8-oxo-dGTP pyrophosphatase MutT (NUDIX family)|nr:NUDIX hydrolase [Actinomycetota bacterium]
MPSTEPSGSPFRRLDEQARYQGPLIRVATASFSGPDGDTFEREIVHHPGAVSMVPLVEEGTVLLVRQFRAAIGSELLELPAGKRDVSGEAPEETARRELEEEIGLRPGRLERLASFYNSPGFSDEHSIVFMALELTPGRVDRQGVEERQMTVVRVELDDVPDLIASGAICDAKTIIGLSLARDTLGR